MYLSAPCLDDLLHDVLNTLLSVRGEVTAQRGTNRELLGVMLHLSNPRARLSRTETRGRPFSALGELCWYLSGREDLETIEYYLPEYRKDAEEGILRGAYGPRLVGARDGNQLEQVLRLLRERPSSRRAVVRLYDAGDLASGQKDVPCTCTLQYFIRNGRLEALTYMRSNDAYLGMPHDIFCFTLLQEYLSRCLEVGVGEYKHVVGSLHLYTKDEASATAFLREGFQSTEHPMPAMPVAEPEASLAKLLRAEAALRMPCVDWSYVDRLAAELDPYWADLVRMLSILRLFRDARDSPSPTPDSIIELKRRLTSKLYFPFIDRLIVRLG